MEQIRGTVRDKIQNRPILSRPHRRVDERDTMFARAERRKGTAEYADYYERRPEYKDPDDRIREKPPLGSPEALYHDPDLANEAEEYFEAIEDIDPEQDVVDEWVDRLETVEKTESVVESLAAELGAVDVGFTDLPTEFIYSYKGRFDADYGDPVDLDHPHAIVFLVEMDHESMEAAPGPPVLKESAKQYYQAAEIAKTIAAVLQAAGFEAEPQFDAHYEVILPPLAVEAGLGELGRNNLLVADRYGSRVRIGAVTTELSLRSDQPIALGVERFCRSCQRCASECPARALELGEKHNIRGTKKWPTDDTRCYSFWRQAGTDCGICMANCPFSHPNSRLHNLTRRMIKHAPWLSPLFLWLDERIYN